MRYFIGLSNICGIHSSLCESLRILGVSADFVTFSDSTYFPHKNSGVVSNIVKYFLRLSKTTDAWYRVPAKLVGGIFCVIHFIISLIKYDVFIFGGTTSLLPRSFDLPVLKLFNKKVVWLFYGSELRPVFMNGVFLYDYNLTYSNQMLQETIGIKNRAAYIERYADIIVAYPCHSMFLTKPFVNFVKIGQPTPTVIFSDDFTPDMSAGNIRLFHGPSSPYSKGTFTIRQWVDRLKQELSNEKFSYELEYIEKQNAPHDDILCAMAGCDIIIDQLYSDVVFSTTAREAIMLNKPVIVGGYLGRYPNLRNHVNPIYQYLKMEKTDGVDPVTYIEPDYLSFRKAVLRLISTKDDSELGLTRRFVYDTWCDPMVFAKRVIQLVNVGVGIPDWYLNPREIIYLHGCGIEEEKLKTLLRTGIKYSADLGMLPERPDVLQELKKWLNQS